MSTQSPPSESMPTPWQALWFTARASGLRLRRTLYGAKARRFPIDPKASHADLAAASTTLLYASADQAEFALQAGKVHNLRIAARALNGVIVPAGEVFSFWAHVPRPIRRNGFARGRELREGCVIPSVGGGLCQLSNALYEVALDSGCDIVERHAHTRWVPGSQAVVGRDATVFWNYVDLRFRPNFRAQLEVTLTARELNVSIRRLSGAAGSETVPRYEEPLPEAKSCETCGVTECFRHSAVHNLERTGATAWLVDAWQPEFSQFVSEQRRSGDHLLLPLDSVRWQFGPYRWPSTGFAKVCSAPGFVLRRAWRSRRLASQGADRQKALLGFDEELARYYGRRLRADATHLVVSQNLLPFLWRDGVLGGRTFDVLMTRLPMAELETILDAAAAAHAESRTLADFRAPREIVAAETDALANASRWITPHSAIAELAGAKAVKLNWRIPKAMPANRGDWVVFPASTLARKGAIEVRERAREDDFPVRLCGSILEAPEFWRGVKTESRPTLTLDDAACVVLPAWVEHWPRRLLLAAASGIPVIASHACGLLGVPGVTTIPNGDHSALQKAIAALTQRTVELASH